MSRRSRALSLDWRRTLRALGYRPPCRIIGVTRRQRKAVVNDAARHGNGRGGYMQAVGGQGELRIRLREIRVQWRAEQRRTMRRWRRQKLGLPEEDRR